MESILAFAAAITVTMTVTVYAPGAAPIEGGHIAASGKRVQDGHAACGPAYPFGTVFEVIGDEAEELARLGISTRVVCEDRGGMVGNRNLDIALTTGSSNRDRLKRANQFGRRRASVVVYLPDEVLGRVRPAQGPR